MDLPFDIDPAWIAPGIKVAEVLSRVLKPDGDQDLKTKLAELRKDAHHPGIFV